jgi:hypothetical protein
MKISWLHKIAHYVLYLTCINIVYLAEKIADKTYELSALWSVDKPPVISLCSVFTTHCFYVPYNTRAACVYILLALVLYVMACILHASKLCLRKVLNICVRYVGLTDSSVTRVRVFRHVRKIAKSVYWLRHDCLSVRPPAWNIRLPLGGFP